MINPDTKDQNSVLELSFRIQLTHFQNSVSKLSFRTQFKNSVSKLSFKTTFQNSVLVTKELSRKFKNVSFP